MTFKQYGVDVASYQPADVSGYHAKGADFCIVKLTQGTGYINPLARYQVASSRKGHMFTHAYHYAEFGSSLSKAKAEAQHFIKVAKQANIDIAKSRYLWLDYEDGNGNTVHGDKAANTAAIIAFMNTVKKAGFKTGLYSGAYVLKTNINYKEVVKKFGTCLWVASYPIDNAVSTADFSYFPSLDGVAIWQFTSHYHGLSLDGNVAVVDLHKKKAAATPAPKKATPKKTASDAFNHVVKVNSLGAGKENWKVNLLNSNGKYANHYVAQGSSWKTTKSKTFKKGKAYLIGKDLWILAKYVKITK